LNDLTLCEYFEKVQQNRDSLLIEVDLKDVCLIISETLYLPIYKSTYAVNQKKLCHFLIAVLINHLKVKIFGADATIFCANLATFFNRMERPFLGESQ